jgi:hypothetical protein
MNRIQAAALIAGLSILQPNVDAQKPLESRLTPERKIVLQIGAIHSRIIERIDGLESLMKETNWDVDEERQFIGDMVYDDMVKLASLYGIGDIANAPKILVTSASGQIMVIPQYWHTLERREPVDEEECAKYGRKCQEEIEVLTHLDEEKTKLVFHKKGFVTKRQATDPTMFEEYGPSKDGALNLVKIYTSSDSQVFPYMPWMQTYDFDEVYRNIAMLKEHFKKADFKTFKHDHLQGQLQWIAKSMFARYGIDVEFMEEYQGDVRKRSINSDWFYATGMQDSPDFSAMKSDAFTAATSFARNGIVSFGLRKNQWDIVLDVKNKPEAVLTYINHATGKREEKLVLPRQVQ